MSLNLGPSSAEIATMHNNGVDEHLTWLAAAGRSARTIRQRRTTLRQFGHWLGGPLATASTADVASFLATPGWSQATRAAYHVHLSGWYRWAVAAGRVEENPLASIPRAKVPRRTPRPIPIADFEAALAIADQRTRLWLLLGRWAGLRCCEIAHLDPGDVDLTRRRLRVTGKGGKVAEVPIPARVAVELADWLALTGTTWQVSPGRVSDLCNRALRTAGSAATMHATRHRMATDLLRTTHDLALVQRALRHESPATTALYCLLDDEALAVAVDQMAA